MSIVLAPVCDISDQVMRIEENGNLSVDGEVRDGCDDGNTVSGITAHLIVRRLVVHVEMELFKPMRFATMGY